MSRYAMDTVFVRVRRQWGRVESRFCYVYDVLLNGRPINGALKREAVERARRIWHSTRRTKQPVLFALTPPDDNPKLAAIDVHFRAEEIVYLQNLDASRLLFTFRLL